LTDDLTKLGNRRALDRRMKHADALRAAGDGVAVLFADIDDFGLYNRLHGDSAGDEVLTVVAEAMQLCLREHDVFRKGGEEFVALLVDVGHGHAAAIAERLRVAVEDLAIPHGGPGRPVVTVTIGVALADDATSVEEARNLAGRRAYWLKVNNRRNQVLAEGPPPADWTPDEDPPEDDAA
jgi:two-component system chemotaxis family response regulator WspR